MRRSPLAVALAAVTAALGCGDTLVDHRAGDLIRPATTVVGNGCSTAAACGPSCEVCTTAVADAKAACVGSPGAEFCDYECTGGLLKCTSGCCQAAKVAAGFAHTCAITAPLPGALYCWGANDAKQVANVASAVVARPLKIWDAGVSEVALGTGHTCAIVSGAVECWGLNADAQVSPRPSLAAPSAIAAGGAHTCAIDGGAVRCWGAASQGQAGGGTPIQAAEAAQAIAAGANHTCAVVGSGAVKCWGSRSAGQLGDGSAVGFSAVPVSAGTLIGVALVAASGNRTCAALSDAAITRSGNLSDALQCWGDAPGPVFALSAVQTTPAVPLKDADPTRLVAVARDALAGLSTGRTHACVQKGTDAIECFGPENADGQLGGIPNGPSETVALSATPLARAFATGADHACAVYQDGGVRCWGRNDQGQLGNGETVSPGVAIVVPVSGL